MATKKQIILVLNVDGAQVQRTFVAEEVEHIDWNPHINDMADTLDHTNDKI